MNEPSPAETFLDHAVAALRTDTFVRLLLSAPADHVRPVERITGRLIDIKGTAKLSLTLREPRRDTTENLTLDAVPGWLAQQLDGRFRSAVLDTTQAGWQFIVNPRGRARLVVHKPNSNQIPSRGHDHAKPRLLDESARPWLAELGLCDATGRMRPSMAGKFRQLERYLEIIGHLAAECDWKPESPVAVADMGCGKGYLTFGVWHLLNRSLGLHADVTGVESRPELVTGANAMVRTLKAGSLRFVQGDIATVNLARLDVLIALHACNTATDDAIASGVRAGARLIVVAPCCHQELRPQLGAPEPLAPLFRHGILAERFSEWLTDGLRALRLEQVGYATRVIEFVSAEHTPRNLLIAGVRRKHPADAPPIAGQVHALKKFFGLGGLASDKIAPA